MRCRRARSPPRPDLGSGGASLDDPASRRRSRRIGRARRFATGPTDLASADLDVPDGAVACHVTINELQTGTGASASDEWVELYNPCAQAMVSGWKLVYEAATGTTPVVYFTFPAAKSIAGHGFLLIVGTAYSGSATPDGQFSNGLKNTGGGVGIESAQGIVDGVGWGVGTTNGLVQDQPAAAPGDSTPPRSLARAPDGADSGHNQTDLKVTASPTPRAPNLIN